MEELKKYIDFINSNTELIASKVNEAFEKEKENIKQKLFYYISKQLAKNPTHYEWEPDDCPYDYSGCLKACGKISKDQTIFDFLEEEYSGNKIPTFISHYGFNYTNFDEEIAYDTRNIAHELMYSSIKLVLENTFNVQITDELFDDISEECYNFDEIYGECLAYEFFTAEGATEFCGINDIKLCDMPVVTILPE